MRAYGGHEVMAIAITAFSMPGPSAATKASARISFGKARKMSVVRISTASTQPPAEPATGPTSSPTGAASTATSTTTNSVMREPWISRERMSRPWSSVPNQCAAEGGSSLSVRRSPSVGE